MAEGVFAINKPPQVSSAQVLRDLQDHFRHSSLFASRLQWQLQQASTERKRSNRQKRIAAENIKIGHGGTLDPLATGVLVVGVGKGTKQMNNFLGCTKTYETVILFGKSTDTYDVAGRVLASAPHQHVTRALVEEKLAAFRGKIKQVPPIYSALKINGIKAYDYARTGKELPRELGARDLEVERCELVEWFEGGKHEYRWPATEAPHEVKDKANKLTATVNDRTQAAERTQKRRLSDPIEEGSKDTEEDRAKKQRTTSASVPDGSKPDPPPQDGGLEHDIASPEPPTTPFTHPSTLISKQMMSADKAKLLHTHETGPLSSETCPAPAARIRVTASSGFYVRSFAHDLGVACGSLALMETLFRSRQGAFDSVSALTYQDLEGGESTWGPKVQSMLEIWNDQHPEEPRVSGRGRQAEKGAWHMRRGQGKNGDMGSRNNMKRNHDRERRNTSSGED